MIIEFVYGAVAQVGRFVGGIPAAFGWSGPSTSPPPTPPTPAEVTFVVPALTRSFTVPAITRVFIVPNPGG